MKKTLLQIGVGSAITFVSLTIAGLIFSACGIFGANPKPPTKAEQAFFDVKTNVVEQIVTKTNMVQVQVPVEVYHTNEVGVLVTNMVLMPQLVPQYVTITNHTELYTYNPNQLSTATTSTAGAIGNAVAPGLGGLVAGIIGGVLSMWAKLRSSKTVGTTLAQNIETIREFLKTSVPNGVQYDSILTKFMQQHQAETGVLQQVVAILQNSVSNKDAQTAADEVRNAIIALQSAGQPVTVAPIVPVPPLK